jgi:hypothetical protein
MGCKAGEGTKKAFGRETLPNWLTKQDGEKCYSDNAPVLGAEPTGIKILAVNPRDGLNMRVNVRPEHLSMIQNVEHLPTLGRKVTVTAEIDPKKENVEIHWGWDNEKVVYECVETGDDRTGFRKDRKRKTSSKTNLDGVASIDFHLPPFGGWEFRVSAGLAANTAEKASGVIRTEQLLFVETELMDDASGASFAFPSANYETDLQVLTNEILEAAGVTVDFDYLSTERNSIPFVSMENNLKVQGSEAYFSATLSPYTIQLLMVQSMSKTFEEPLKVTTVPANQPWTSQPICREFWESPAKAWYRKETSFYVCPCKKKFTFDDSSAELSKPNAANTGRTITIDIPKLLIAAKHQCKKPQNNGGVRLNYWYTTHVAGVSTGSQKDVRFQIYLAVPKMPAVDLAATFLAHEICHQMGMLQKGAGTVQTQGSTLCHCTAPNCLMHFEIGAPLDICSNCLQKLKRLNLGKVISKLNAKKGSKA